jgi:STE24 endopeptidase
MWLACYLRSTVGLLVWTSAILTVLYLLICFAGFYWWPLAAILSLVWLIRSSRARPNVFGPNYNRVEPVDDPDVVQRATALVKESGFQVEGIYCVRSSEDTIRPNAYLYGTGKNRRLMVTDTLLDGFTPDEIAVVLAHEIGHLVYRHIPKKLAMAAACGLPHTRFSRDVRFL